VDVVALACELDKGAAHAEFAVIGMRRDHEEAELVLHSLA
jgi:hypothetical protein